MFRYFWIYWADLIQTSASTTVQNLSYTRCLSSVHYSLFRNTSVSHHLHLSWECVTTKGILFVLESYEISALQMSKWMGTIFVRKCFTGWIYLCQIQKTKITSYLLLNPDNKSTLITYHFKGWISSFWMKKQIKTRRNHSSDRSSLINTSHFLRYMWCSTCHLFILCSWIGGGGLLKINWTTW